MNKAEQKFYEVFTELQCYILANMNKGDIHEVTATHYNVIEYILRNDRCTGKQLANAFNITAAAISRQLRFLLEKQLIEQHQSSADRRIFHLTVTEKGKFIVDNSENFRERVAKTVYRSMTESELSSLVSLLSKVMHQLKES
ncbi:MAG: MarR family transcriptional regulator [Chitinophagaceae bacterium]|nr:MAG: MarR family transcriptional regulator [Chitinophagaceae bacterium]